jgi:hypothetical protein
MSASNGMKLFDAAKIGNLKKGERFVVQGSKNWFYK